MNDQQAQINTRVQKELEYRPTPYLQKELDLLHKRTYQFITDQEYRLATIALQQCLIYARRLRDRKIPSRNFPNGSQKK